MYLSLFLSFLLSLVCPLLLSLESPSKHSEEEITKVVDSRQHTASTQRKIRRKTGERETAETKDLIRTSDLRL